MENITASEELTTTKFDTVTQYDKQFNGLFSNPNKKGFSCSFFSLITAWKFLNGETPDVISHEATIAQSLLAQSTNNIDFGITFEELLSSYTDLNPTQIYATSAELINSGELGFDQIFPPIVDDTHIAIIILKNERYLNVLINKNGYQFRDCHESTQYNFATIDELIIHLITAYQFTEEVNAGGMEYHEYSSIEFLTLNSKFYLTFAEMLGIVANEDLNQNYNLNQNKNANIDLNGDVFNIPPETILSPDEISYLEMLNDQLNHNTNKETNLTKAEGDMTDDEMLYMQMLDAEINETVIDTKEEFDIPIETLGDFKDNNDVDDIEIENEFVDFE